MARPGFGYGGRQMLGGGGTRQQMQSGGGGGGDATASRVYHESANNGPVSGYGDNPGQTDLGFYPYGGASQPQGSYYNTPNVDLGFYPYGGSSFHPTGGYYDVPNVDLGSSYGPRNISNFMGAFMGGGSPQKLATAGGLAGLTPGSRGVEGGEGIYSRGGGGYQGGEGIYSRGNGYGNLPPEQNTYGLTAAQRQQAKQAFRSKIGANTLTEAQRAKAFRQFARRQEPQAP